MNRSPSPPIHNFAFSRYFLLELPPRSDVETWCASFTYTPPPVAPEAAIFGERLHELRTKPGLTFEAVADAADISITYESNLAVDSKGAEPEDTASVGGPQRAAITCHPLGREQPPLISQPVAAPLRSMPDMAEGIGARVRRKRLADARGDARVEPAQTDGSPADA